MMMEDDKDETMRPVILKKVTLIPRRIEVVDSDGHLRSCPGLGVVDGGRTRSYDRLAGPRRIRVGSWNVGSLTRKLLELCDTLRRHKVDIACFQETKWKGSRAREGNGYKLWYSGSSNARNGVGIILAGRLKDNVVRVTRRSDRIMAILVVIEGETANVISAYAPQVGLSDAEKKRFWDALDELVRECPTDQRLIIGGDLNGHIGAAADGYTGVHGGFGFGDRNEEGCTILEFATAHELVVANSFFKKSDAHLITFQSGGHNTQINYLLVRRGDLRACKDCIAYPEEVTSASGADQMWNTLARVMKDAAKESLGVANEIARTHSTHRKGIKLLKGKRKQQWPTRKTAYKDLYKKLDSKEGANDTYKIAKARERRRKDIGNNPSDESRADVGRAVGNSSPHMHYECYYSRINQGEVKTALKKMRRNKAVGPDQIPIEAWRSLKHEGVKWLTCLFNKIFSSAKMPDEWRLSEVIPIYKNKGDAQACGNYRDLRALESWRKALEDNGLRVSREKTEYLRCDFGRYEVVHQEMDIRIGDRILQPKESFRYLGSVIHRSGGIGWTKWKAASGVLCERVRPKLRWEDRLKMDMKELLLSEDMTSDRNAWRDRIRISG
nr:hypothetical protein [Tanacetum cinerariifolium]